MQHFTKGENIGLVVSKKSRQLSTGYMFITNTIADLHILDSAAVSTYIFPLYLYVQGDIVDGWQMPDKRIHKFNSALIDLFINFAGLQFADTTRRDG